MFAPPPFCTVKKKKKKRDPQLDLNHGSALINCTTRPHGHPCLPEGGSRNVLLEAGLVHIYKCFQGTSHLDELEAIVKNSSFK